MKLHIHDCLQVYQNETSSLEFNMSIYPRQYSFMRGKNTDPFYVVGANSKLSFSTTTTWRVRLESANRNCSSLLQILPPQCTAGQNDACLDPPQVFTCGRPHPTMSSPTQCTVPAVSPRVELITSSTSLDARMTSLAVH